MTIVEYVITAALLCVLLYVLAIKPAGSRRMSEIRQEVRYYAHRGLHDNRADAPENSLRAFGRAVEAGYGIELDVQLTKDKVPVVFHDDDLKRLCGQEKRVEDLRYEDLRRYRILGTDQSIPRLADVLNTIDGHVPLIIEYKLKSTDASVCVYADRVLKEYKGKYCIESFHPFVLLWYRHNRPDVIRGMLSTNYSRVPKGQKRLFHFLSRHLLFNFFTKPDFIAYDCNVKKAVSRDICRNLFHCCMVAWTVRGQEEKEELKQSYDWFIFEGFHP